MPATLPTDHRVRAPVPADDAAVLRVMLARDVEDLGHPDFTIDDLRADWATPGLDLTRDAWVVEDPAGEIVASGLLLGDDALIYVHPEAEGRGLGTALRELAEARGRERGSAVLRQFVPLANEPAAALLLDAGWWPAQHYLRMRMSLEAGVPEPDAALRTFERDHDELGV